ncbi:MAG TPA: RHS repeat-associated core domain-containing protein, partial [Niastella sp.]
VDGQLEAVLETGDRKTTLSYDEDDNLVTVQLPQGSTAHWKYDALGRCIQTSNSDGEIRNFKYDALNRLRNLYLPDGNAVQLEYNGYEEITKIKDNLTELQLEYTAMGNVKKRRWNNSELQFLYDTEERLTTIINEAGRHYFVNYNKRGEIISETRFDGSTRQYELDATGKTIKTLRPGNRHTRFEYDANGQVVKLEYHDGSYTLFSYDDNGNLKEAINEHCSVRIARNKDGFVEMEQQDGYTIQSKYDKTGNRIHINSSLGANIQLTRNTEGQVTNMQAKMHEALWEAKIKFNKAGDEIERILPGGLTSEWKYDQSGRPGEHKVSSRGVIQSWKQYTWNVNEQLTNIFDAVSQSNTFFKHDAAGNLVFAQYAESTVIHRTTGETGNIYETTGKGDRRYNTNGALLESDSHIYKYDDEGNLISKTEKATQRKTKYAWYADGMLKSVLHPDGKKVTFTYDALGRRVSKTVNGKITRWVWDGNVPLHEWTYDEKDKPTAVVDEWGEIIYDKEEPNPQNAGEQGNGITWVFDAESFVPSARIENGKTWSIISDHLGTPKEAYDANGKKVWECTLDIYGRTRMIDGNKNFIPFRYQGQYEDEETGLYYNRFRYYNPEEGLYISADPVSVTGGLNIYAYVHDTNNWVDIFGLKECARRVARMQKAMSKAEKGRTTFAVARVRLKNGKKEYWVSAAGKRGYVPPRIRKAAGTERVARAKDPLGTPKNRLNDAEQTIKREADRIGANIEEIGATRDMCHFCQEVFDEGHLMHTVVTPLKP